MTEKLPKILMVEDDRDVIRAWSLWLRQESIMLVASTVEQASELFIQNPDICLIVMDGCLTGFELETVDLIKKFRQTFAGPIVAASANRDYCLRMMEAGCSHDAGRKDKVPELVLSLLAQLKMT